MGSFYNQHKVYLDKLKKIQWNIVEQEHYVKLGIKHFQEGNLKFYYSIRDCFDSTNVDVAFFSSVLQYLESPFKILEELFIYSPEFIIIDRTAFIDRERDRLTIHKIPEKIYPNSLPC